MILILGATGQVGTCILGSLLEGGVGSPPIRVLARRPEALQKFASSTIDVRQGHFEDRDDVVRALDGVTDLVLTTGDDPGHAEREIRLIDWAKAATKPRIIKISAITASLTPRVSVGVAHGAIEDHLKRSGLSWVILQPTFFLQSLALFRDPVRKQNVFPLPTHGGAVAFVDVRDIGAAAARVVLDPSLSGKTFILTGPEAWTMSQVCAALSERLGRRIRHVNPPHLLFKTMLCTFGRMSWSYASLVSGVAQACAAGDEANVRADLSELIGRRPLGLGAYLDKAIDQFR
ncbi:NmrA family NAD(P)-binding protein [Bradyrhizobium sp. TM239]|uniref:NmrA family NAD(P)-binding protein n=1 Tax=Bradyrhizobium sp. TM239 TaxID=2599802 RepID=UPI0027D70AD8|nr:SDR family oxidoreductase [Bradyrhizobium sp. TM239]